MTTPLSQQVQEQFCQRVGEDPACLVRAPGRVNLIGEHTDYNDGFVLPLAIDRAVWMAVRRRDDGRVRVWSMDMDEEAGFTVAGLHQDNAGWIEYVKGIAWAMTESGHALRGWDGVVASDVPIGAGLSSSAALELAAARAFAAVSDLRWDATDMARAAQRAENQWVGVACGIMDQLVVAAGREDHALVIDCRSCETTPVPLPPRAVIVVLDTGTRRDLSSSAYNQRRHECETAARAFRVEALRDLSPADLSAWPPGLNAAAIKRARHVVTENDRVLKAVAAMTVGNAVELGALMRQSHRSLRDDFEVSSPALDAMVECADRAGCVGARMTGAGFGGCVIALVDADHSLTFVARVAAEYREATRLSPEAYVCRATAGASATWLTEDHGVRASG